MPLHRGDSMSGLHSSLEVGAPLPSAKSELQVENGDAYPDRIAALEEADISLPVPDKLYTSPSFEPPPSPFVSEKGEVMGMRP